MSSDASHHAITKLLGGLVPKGAIKAVHDRAAQAVWHLVGAKFPAIIAQSQSAKDDRDARSAFRQGLVAAATSKAAEDPHLVKRMLDRLVEEEFGKQHNRESIAILALTHIAENTDAESNNEEDLTDKEETLIDNDWLNTFTSYGENATSDQLKELFARILSGEIRRPGSFSKSTIRAISELDHEIAKNFSGAWSASVGSEVDYSPEWSRGEGYTKWKRLAEAGLMANTTSSQFLPEFVPLIEGCALWGPMGVGTLNVLVFFNRDCSARWNHIDFTRVGREIGTLLPTPDYAANMRSAARRLPTQGIKKILLQDGSVSEVIWEG